MGAMNDDPAKVPVAGGFALPAEWARHARTWLAWPARAATWHGGIEAARAVHVELAKALAGFEPVTMVCNPAEMAEASLMCGPGIDLMPVPLSDGWMRDIGPTFVTNPSGEIAGIDWIFNGWGGLHNEFALDAKVAAELIRLRGCPAFQAPIVLEGGAFSGDGAGTLLVTEECLLDPRRNPGKSKAEIEAVLRDYLGITKVIWLGRGYEGDETGGHIDEIACFVKPGAVMIQMTNDPEDANYLVQHDNYARLRSAFDAGGNRLDVIEIPQPARRAHGRRRLTLSYINFAFANGGVIMPSVGDACDDVAFRIFTGVFPDRKVVQLLADDLVIGGGGIHCITQQEPAV
jgi:agmatine deiminase